MCMVCDDAGGGRPQSRGISAEYVRFTNRAKENAAQFLCADANCINAFSSRIGLLGSTIRFYNG